MQILIDWNVRPVPVQEDGLVGRLFLPSSEPPFPVTITLGGSAPGIFTAPGHLLASQGIAVLALAYFGMESLPATLRQIPLEYFGKAIRWCKRRPELRSDKIAVAGVSRGGELALVVASVFPEIGAVVGWAPSGLTYAGMVRPGEDPVAAWSIGGRDLPFAGFDRTAVKWDEVPIRLAPGFSAGLSHDTAVKTAQIPVERIRGPILLISGTDDQVWPSTILADIAVKRLREHQFPFSVEHVWYEGAGHAIGPPHPYAPAMSTHTVHPVLGYDFELGGTPELNQRASEDSWEKVIGFLKAWCNS